MCGICGWIETKEIIDYLTLMKMNNIARHRGPDDEGYITITDKMICLAGEETCGGNSEWEKIKKSQIQSHLAFGHRRLSIIDLTPAGHQPMANYEKKICVTFNGEIYNYIEIKEELKKSGYMFRTDSDTEVLLCAYEEWGEDCVNHFNGMWAFAIWDADKNKLFCSRDRLGAKPFYYYKDDDRFLFSSEIKQLCQNPCVPRILNEDIMIAQIMWGITDFSDQTLINDIFNLPGGYNIRIILNDEKDTFKEFTVYQYWDINFGGGQKIASDTFKLLRDAIEIRTRSDVPVGVLLSGGLDSSVLVAEVSGHYKRTGRDCSNLNTYTSSYEGFSEGDERSYAEMVNQYCGTKQNFIYPDPEDTYQIFEKMVWHMEGDCSFNSLGAFATLGEIAAKGGKVLLNGQGADETMFGYERYYAFYFWELLKCGKLSEFVKEYRNAARNSKLNLVQLLQFFVYFNFHFVRKYRCDRRMKKYVSNEVRKKFRKNKEIYQYLYFSSLQELQYNELRKTQLTHILRMDDRGYMAFSLESRVPYIDYRYIENAVKVQEEDKIQEGYTKYLLRKFVDGRLPHDVVWRKNKMGWPSPKKRWVSRFDSQKVNDLFVHSKCSKYFNIQELGELYKDNPSSWSIEKFMIIELFVRLFNVEVL